MHTFFLQLGALLLSFAFFCAPLFPYIAFADTYAIQEVIATPNAQRFNNENWYSLAHPEVAEFTVHADGSSDGITVTGVPFAQYNIPNNAGIRVQRFEIQDHYHYIVEGEVVNTFEELSTRLALAYDIIHS